VFDPVTSTLPAYTARVDPYTPQPYIDPVLVSIGDIHCTRTEVITPTGRFPLAGTQWAVMDQTQRFRVTPTWATVLAIVGLLVVCVFSLLLLLVKEDRIAGAVAVSVISPDGRAYTGYIPVNSIPAVQDVYARVQYARQLAIH
jgi:hypothetical protein